MQDKCSVFRSKAPGICCNGPAPNPIPAQVIRRSDIEVTMAIDAHTSPTKTPGAAEAG